MAEAQSTERMKFQAEVSRLLDIVAHSLYSEREIFLRELISNASDACDRLRYAGLTDPGLIAGDPNLLVNLEVDPAARTLILSDNGIGMSRDELIENLGTIARSGTAAFLGNLGEDKSGDLSLIGQFGVGFYSAFMVADRVVVTSRRAGAAEAWRWSSDGRGEFAIEPVETASRGTRIDLHLKDDAAEFLDLGRLRRIVKTYSDHIALPVVLVDGGTRETLNAASALWTRPKGEITAEQYREFYHHVAHAIDEPWAFLHFQVEGKLEYRALLFIPSAKPLDLFHPERKHRVKLYVRRVFITDECDELVPGYLRFMRGVVDSEDLPLNVSREMLQASPTIARIRAAIVKRTLSELDKRAAGEASDEDKGYLAFWKNFGAVLKEGIYEDGENRGALLKLARFRSTAGAGWRSLEEYVSAMKPGQEAIYTLAGEDEASLRRSPHLEGFGARGLEVLLLTDPVDEFWMPAAGAFAGKPFRSITRAGIELSAIPVSEAFDALTALLRLALKDVVKDVRASSRLTESAVCLVADEHDVDIHLERLLKSHGALDHKAKRILEINPRHGLIRALADGVRRQGAPGGIDDFALALYDQALILEGEPPPDASAFARRLTRFMEQGLKPG